MIKIFFSKCLLVCLLLVGQASAQEFSGCGEYVFNGVLKHNDRSVFKMVYIVNEGTKSQMIFDFVERDDVMKLALMLNVPSSFKAKITRLMDGTKGVLSYPVDIDRRFLDPLSNKTSGLTKIKNLKCN